MARITIDPVTRIEGHLRIDVEVDVALLTRHGQAAPCGAASKRSCAAGCARGLGLCAALLRRLHDGACIASVRAVEDALALDIPPNAQFIRNLILIGHALHDHSCISTTCPRSTGSMFVRSQGRSGPRGFSLAESSSSWQGNSRRELEAVQDKVKGIVAGGQLVSSRMILGHPAMRLRPEMNLILFAHYLQALEFQRKSCQVARYSRRQNSSQPESRVGGVMNAINLNSLATMNMDRLGMLKASLKT